MDLAQTLLPSFVKTIKLVYKLCVLRLVPCALPEFDDLKKNVWIWNNIWVLNNDMISNLERNIPLKC